MNIIFVDVPIVTDSTSDGLKIIEADSPPLRLLALASVANKINITPQFIELGEKYPQLLLKNDAGDLAEEITALSAEAIVLCVDSFNFFGALKFLRKYSELSRRGNLPPVFVGGIYPGLYEDLFFNFSEVKAILTYGCETLLTDFFALLSSQGSFSSAGFDNSVKGVQTRAGQNADCENAGTEPTLNAFDVISRWERWERGVSLGETFGFPLGVKPHFQNLPVAKNEIYPSTVDRLKHSAEILDGMRYPELHVNCPQLKWERNLLDKMGDLSLQYLDEKQLLINYEIQATPAELLSYSVLPSLSLLEVRSLTVHAGGAANFGSRGDESENADRQLEECLRSVKQYGLSSVTTVLYIIGTEYQTMEEVLQIIQKTVDLTVKNSIAEVRFEWWYNVPGSPSHLLTENWSDLIHNSEQPWFSNVDVVSKIPDLISPEERQTIRKTIQLYRGLNSHLKVNGPDTFAL